MNHFTQIVINTQFVGIHQWIKCPFEEVSYLKNKHRHVFHVQIKAPVDHNDRSLEFFMVKKELDEFLASYPEDIGSMSCEMICEDILQAFPYVSQVSVMEDNENGAEAIR